MQPPASLNILTIQKQYKYSGSAKPPSPLTIGLKAL